MSDGVAARERLLSAAALAFSRVGFEGASTRAIASAAGVPQGLVRHHFGSKDGLWSAVVEHGLAAVQSELALLPSGLTVAAWAAIVERHLTLAALLLQALLEGGARAEQAIGRTGPVWKQLRALQRSAPPYVDDGLLPMWLLASVAIPLLRRSLGESASRATRTQEIDRLFTWLCRESMPELGGPFAVHVARSRLRGAG